MFTALRSWAGCPAVFTMDWKQCCIAGPWMGSVLREWSGGEVSKYDGATIEVVNWEKYNPRTDSKRPTWFRLDKDVALGQGFFGLDSEQKWLWVVILSLVCGKAGEPITWNSAYVQAITGIKPKKQDQTLDIFIQFVRLRVSRTDLTVELEVTQDNSPTTNITNERTNKTNSNSHPLFEIWNRNRGTLPEVKELTEGRKKKAADRWKDKPSTEYWTEVVLRMSRSPFCRGEKNDPNGSHRNWKADFDFLLKPETHAKVSEGKYDDRNAPARRADLEEMDRELKEQGIDVA